MEIYVVGKRWMWKAQHISGQREINELHVPVGQPVKLIIGSEDVLHSYYIPAFRVKMDAVPGRYTTMWFEATKAGSYHLLCAEFCGMSHSKMIGRVVAMAPADFQTWLGGGRPTGSLADAGLKLFTERGCATCHMETNQGRGPPLKGVFGSTVKLAERRDGDGGRGVPARVDPESDGEDGGRLPAADAAVPGPAQRGADQQLVAYIKSLSAGAGAAAHHGRLGGAAGARHESTRGASRRRAAYRPGLDRAVALSRPKTRSWKPPSPGARTT